MASSVKEKDITEFRATGYLAKEIAHRLPAKGQVVPMLKPNERVVFILHFLHGLGFPLHPFVHKLMFYYGLDFHDLAPYFFLNISAFFVVCEAFLRIQPHLEMWLKVFNVKPKVVDGQHTECGGAMVSKLTNVSWPKGTFVETVKEWQKLWFYITEPRDATWAACNAPRPELQMPSMVSEFHHVICLVHCFLLCIICIASCHHAIFSQQSNRMDLRSI